MLKATNSYKISLFLTMPSLQVAPLQPHEELAFQLICSFTGKAFCWEATQNKMWFFSANQMAKKKIVWDQITYLSIEFKADFFFLNSGKGTCEINISSIQLI